MRSTSGKVSTKCCPECSKTVSRYNNNKQWCCKTIAVPSYDVSMHCTIWYTDLTVPTNQSELGSGYCMIFCRRLSRIIFSCRSKTSEQPSRSSEKNWHCGEFEKGMWITLALTYKQGIVSCTWKWVADRPFSSSIRKVKAKNDESRHLVIVSASIACL